MRCFTETEARDWLAPRGVDVAGLLAPGPASGAGELCFQIPAETRTQWLMARDLVKWLEDYEFAVLWCEHWRRAKPDEQALVRRLRRGHAEERPFEEAPVHLFEPVEKEELTAWVCLAMGFCWKARIFALPFHAESLCVTPEELISAVAAPGARLSLMRAIAQRYEAPIYRETH